jgi:hypothetical protein
MAKDLMKSRMLLGLPEHLSTGGGAEGDSEDKGRGSVFEYNYNSDTSVDWRSIRKSKSGWSGAMGQGSREDSFSGRARCHVIQYMHATSFGTCHVIQHMHATSSNTYHVTQHMHATSFNTCHVNQHMHTTSSNKDHVNKHMLAMSANTCHVIRASTGTVSRP